MSIACDEPSVKRPGTITETILVLEDDVGVAKLQQRRLERAGFRVLTTSSATEARDLILHNRIDLLVLDYRLPDVADGIEFYQRLKEEGIQLPVIMVTGEGGGDDATVIRALRAGIRDYVTKSLEYLSYLPEAVSRVLSQEREARDRQRAEEALRQANAQLEHAMATLQEKSVELHATSQQLWQSAKLASVGELAASIAHELNNPLGTISLRLETILDRTPADAATRPLLAIVEQEVERMARLVGNLLQFSRSGSDQSMNVNVCDEILKAAELTEYHLRRRGIEMVQDFPHDVPGILADRQKLRQVFLNLFTNAGDAMPRGGTLSTRVRSLSESALEIDVTDTGHGIPAEVLPHVMDPFFTTKEEGKGTGLGLAICRRIIQEHQGTIAVESTVGKGTTIRIVLPVPVGNIAQELEDDPDGTYRSS